MFDHEVYELGIVVGWTTYLENADGKWVRVFIPRRDEEVLADRNAMIEALKNAEEVGKC